MSLSWIPEIRREIAINRSISKFYHSPRRLRKEVNRLKTFDNWPLSFIDRRKLAKDGFFYTKTEDVCRCAFCFIDIGYWVPEDDVRENHRTASPGCPIVRGLPCENIPVPDAEVEEQSESESEPEQESESESESESDIEMGPEPKMEVGIDVFGPFGMLIRPFSGPEKPCKDSLLTAASYLCKYFEHNGVSKMTGPVTPQFAVFEVRLKTYDSWKYSEIQDPEKLAQAGFYHIGTEDQVLCFYCGAGLHKWKPEDEPWLEHAKHSFKCGFVILQKGADFVQNALERKNVILSPSEVKNILDDSEHSSEGGVEKNAPVQEVNPQTKSPVNPAAESEERIKDLKQSTETSVSAGSELKLCRICYVREREIVFLPCGHFISCTLCASSLSACALCRTKFEAVVRSTLDSEGKDDKCLICKSAQREVVFLPCSHFISCSKCAKPKTSCVLCQKRFKLLVRAYLS